jgi:UDP-GlcNAc:undecaprenyl-phosphate GlcNAc-1-phosphate transferase
MDFYAWLAPLIAFAVCWITLAWLLRRDRLPLDQPNERSLHVCPTPRIGGIGILAGLLVAGAILHPTALLPMLLGAFLLAAISLLDDFSHLSAALRLLVHLAIAVACVATLPGIAMSYRIFAVLGIVWTINLYNFMDGADGLAGGMAAIGFGALAVASWLAQAPELATLCAVIAAAALAFLRFNFPPARLFMGDAGSIPLGFLAAVLSLHGVLEHLWSWPFPVLVLSPFWVDASVTLIRRALRGEKIWQAHRAHYYQRVVLLGATHRQLALAAYALMLVCTALAFWLRAQPQYTAGIGILATALYLTLFTAIDRRCKRVRPCP